MKRTYPLLLSAVLVTAAVVVKTGRSAEPAAAFTASTEPAVSEPAVRRALSPDVTVANAAIAELRASGPAGLEALRNDQLTQLRRYMAMAPGERANQPEWQRLCAALDGVGAAR